MESFFLLAMQDRLGSKVHLLPPAVFMCVALPYWKAFMDCIRGS